MGNGFASVPPPYVAASRSPGTLAPQVSPHRVVRVREADHEDRGPLTDRRRPEPDPHPERGSHPGHTSSLELWSLCPSGSRHPGRKRPHSIAPSHLKKMLPHPGPGNSGSPAPPELLLGLRSLLVFMLPTAGSTQGPSFQGRGAGTEHSHSRLQRNLSPLATRGLS